MVLKNYCIRQPTRQLGSSSYNHNTLTTFKTSVKESLQMHFKVAYSKEQLHVHVANKMRES